MRRIGFAAWLLFAWIAIVVGPVGTARAHLGSTKAIAVDVRDDGIDVEVAIDAIDATVALGVPLDADDATLRMSAPLLVAWLAEGLTMTADGVPCPTRVELPRVDRNDGRPRIRVPIAFACPRDASTLRLRDDTVFGDDPEHEAFVAITAGDERTAAVLRADARELVLPTTTARVGATFVAFVREGAHHLVTGYDHLLFVLSLVLVAALAVPRQGLRPALRRVAWVITAFTAGHSLSLAAAALDLVRLPVAAVETAIAASIVLVAIVHAVRPHAGVTGPGLAGAVGLVHGFGFSSVLGEIGLPAHAKAVALFGFNVGIELAQLCFVALVFVPLAQWARRGLGYRRVAVQAGSLVIAAFGSIWMIERGLQQSL